jgi:hypothetical protein
MQRESSEAVRSCAVNRVIRPASHVAYAEVPTDPRMFVIPTLVGFHCCDRRADEHPLQAYSAAAKGAAGEAGMQRLLDGFFAAHRATLMPSRPRTRSEQCSDYSTACPSGGAMPRWLGGPSARVRCGLHDEIRPSRGRTVFLNNACRHALHGRGEYAAQFGDAKEL